MAKTPPATVERYMIHVEASKDDMGHVVAEAIKRGLTNIGYELITDVQTFRKNGARKLHDVTGLEFARPFVKDNASFTAIALVNYFKEYDRTNGSAYKALRDLVKEGAIKKLSLGNYQRAGVKALPAPAPKGKAQNGRGGARRRHEIGNKDVILKRIDGRARFTIKELQDHFTNIRRNPHSVSPIISKLFNAKLITQIESGVYAWGGKVKKKKVANKTQAAVRKKRAAPVAEASSLERTNG